MKVWEVASLKLDENPCRVLFSRRRERHVTRWRDKSPDKSRGYSASGAIELRQSFFRSGFCRHSIFIFVHDDNIPVINISNYSTFRLDRKRIVL